MGPILSALVNLQGIESELRKTRKRLKKGQQSVVKQTRRIEQLEASRATKREEIKQVRMQSDRLELELHTRDDEIAKLRVALNQAKTNKDYSAILSRINTDKADKSKLEEQILKLESQIEADQAECKQIEDSIAEEKETLATLTERTGETGKKIESEIAQLDARRQEACSQVPEKELELFDRLAERYDGEVMVEINVGRNERTCQGCYMSLPLELVNMLMTKDEVVTCPTCGRILVLESQTSQQTA